MKISVDTLFMWAGGVPYEERYKTVAELGFKYISLCDFNFPGGLKRPKVTHSDIVYHKKLLNDYGLEAASFVTGFPISSPDEYWRTAAIEWWKRMFDIGEEFGVKVFNSELGGDINQPALCEEQFMRSLDVLVPICESRGLRLEFQAHPNDFYERHREILPIFHYYSSPSLGYLYAVPHSFRYDDGKGDVGKMIREAAPYLTHVIFADTHNHIVPWRYNINPPDSPARVHGHLGYKKGDINWDAVFDALRDIKFNEKKGTIACVTLFGFPELFNDEASEFLRVIREELGEE